MSYLKFHIICIIGDGKANSCKDTATQKAREGFEDTDNNSNFLKGFTSLPFKKRLKFICCLW